MTKIVFMLTSMNIGGTEKALLNLIKTLPEDKFDIDLLLFRKDGGFLKFVPENVKIKTVNNFNQIRYRTSTSILKIIIDYIKNFKFIEAIRTLYWHFVFRLTGDRSFYYHYVLRNNKLDGKYDIAVAFEGPDDLISTYVFNCIDAKKKFQWIHFDVGKYVFNKKFAKRIYTKLDKICVVSDEARHSLISIIPELENKTETVKNIISAKQCMEFADNGIGYDDDFDGIRILTVGRLSEEKGQDIIPSIAVKLLNNGIFFKWYIMGDGPLRKAVEEKISYYNLQNNVVLLGAKDNPYPFFRDADIYVQTSLHEGFCITLAEAKVFNLKIISTECAGAHEQLDKVNNSLIVPRDTEELTKAIMNIINID